jgi:quinol monooxygenase YgiN
MTKYSLYVRLEAKPGKEQEVADFLVGALPLVNQEPETTAWFALRMGPNVFGIFDAFPSESGRDAHLNGEVAKQLMAKASDLFDQAAGDQPCRRSGRQAAGLTAKRAAPLEGRLGAVRRRGRPCPQGENQPFATRRRRNTEAMLTPPY